MDIEELEIDAEDYNLDDQSDGSGDKSGSEDEPENSDSDNEEITATVVPSAPKSSTVINRTGNDRTTLIKLDKYERCSAVIFYAKEIEKGKKIPAIIPSGMRENVTDTIALAYMSVMSTVRKSTKEVKTEKQIADGASICLKRRIKENVYDVWKLHELIWFEKEEDIFSDYDLIDSQSIKLGDWFKM